MKTKTIYLLRHGQTDYNKNGLVQGRGVDASLNDVGRKQATAASNHFKGLPIDRFFSSSLIRTHETLAPFGVDFTPLEGFDEISWGAFEGLETTPDDKNLYRATINGWRTGLLDAAIGGGESPRDVKARQEEAMKQVLEDESETILICMHGRAMRILLCWLLSYPLNYMDGFPHQNCAFYGLQYVADRFSIRAFNYCKHLDVLKKD